MRRRPFDAVVWSSALAVQFAGFDALAERLAGWRDATRGEPDELRRRSFVVAHLAVGVTPFAAFPMMLALGLDLSTPAVALFAWATAPILIALHVARTDGLERACAMSAVAFTALIAGVCALDHGAASLAMAWLALPLGEAALSGAMKPVRFAVGAALTAFGSIVALTAFGAAPVAPGGPALAIATGVAAVYALSLGLRAGLLLVAAERAGREGRALSELFSGAVSDLVTRHAADGRLVYASPAAQRLLGCAARELVGDGLLARVHIADRPAFLRALSEALRSDESAMAEIRLRRDDAEATPFAWVEMRAQRSEVEGAASSIAVFRDVSERKVQQAALIAAREEAERGSIANTRFLANMSHELRTPLNAIIGFSEVLSDEALCRLTPSRRSDYAALIHKSGGHLLEVVNSILDMAKIESGAFAILPEPCALQPVVAHCAGLMALKAEAAGVAVETAVDADLPEIVADRRAVTQVLINLLANAIKFTPRGGAVTIAGHATAGGVVLSVRDTGVGIPPEAMRRLGEPFFQAEDAYARRREGCGLGLSVVRGLVALHNGRMTVDSVLGVGTCVTVTLPSGGQGAVGFFPALHGANEDHAAKERRRA